MKITCGRCNSSCEQDDKIDLNGWGTKEVKCPICNFSAKDVQENKQEKKKVLKG